MPFALVDANNFFVSCERVFNPRLEGRPVIVLSNNDGCAISRSNEAKALGIKMGTPWHELRPHAERRGIVALSSNYELYGDMSQRLMHVLGDYSPQCEVYSIDECFLGLQGFSAAELPAYARMMRQRVKQWLGLPVCVGLAASKTLAKLANHCAKTNLAGLDGVCDFAQLSAAELHRLFSRLDVGEIWGVGRQLRSALHARGIGTVEDLRRAQPRLLRREFSVTLERTIAELNGEACFEFAEAAPDKQQIISSRSFGRYVYTLEELREAVASYIGVAAAKLRAQDSVAGLVQVYIRTNPHREDAPQYQQSIIVPLSAASSDTRRLTQAAWWGLARIYRSGYAYQKAGVALCEIGSARNLQSEMFDTRHDNPAVMAVLDRVNALWGAGTLRLAAEGVSQAWRMRRERRSPRYTTAWPELPKAS